MLQTIHDKLRGIFAIVILGALGVVFVFWGVDASVGSFAKAQGIEVNGKEVDAEGVRSQYQDELSRYQAAFGAAGIPDELRTQLQTRALEQAVQNELVRQRTRKLRFVASDKQVLEAIQQIQAFQVDGKFSTDAYHAALGSAAMRPEQFEADQREFAIARQLDRGISSSTFVLPGEIDRRIALLNEAREIAWVIIPAAEFQGTVAHDEAALKAYYDGHQSLYMTEEQAAIEYIELNIELFASGITISEDQLREYYESNKERYSTAGRRHARHILIAIKDEEAAAAAGARARSVYERARAGEDFAALAREFSDDDGSKGAGGDLGWALRSDFVGAFGDAVWDMQPGQIREPVRTEFGWHVIRLEEAEADATRSFEEVRAQIEPEQRRAEVEKLFGDQQEMLDTLAFESAGNLAEVAAKLDLPIRRIERFTRSGGGDLGASPALIEAVFAPEVLSGSELRTVKLGEGRVVAVRAAAHDPARARPLDEVRDQVVAAARLESAQRLAAEKATAVATHLSGGGDWAVATSPWRSGVAESASYQPKLVRRDEALVPVEITAEAFRAARPAGRARFGTAQLGTGDAVVWMVSAVRTGTLATLSPTERQQAFEAARERANIADASVYVNAMRAAAEVDVNPQLFQ
jgi:peptidyl-prolyl cis-trans isomerase D